MSSHHACQHSSAQPSLCQSLDEMEFQRGIWSAALDGETDRVAELLQRTSVDACDAAGYTALHYAARSGHPDICRLLLRRGADVNARTRAGQATALHRAAANGKPEVCRLLVESGADVEARDADGKSALQRAVAGKHETVATLLIELGAISSTCTFGK